MRKRKKTAVHGTLEMIPLTWKFNSKQLLSKTLNSRMNIIETRAVLILSKKTEKGSWQISKLRSCQSIHIENNCWDRGRFKILQNTLKLYHLEKILGKFNISFFLTPNYFILGMSSRQTAALELIPNQKEAKLKCNQEK